MAGEWLWFKKRLAKAYYAFAKRVWLNHAHTQRLEAILQNFQGRPVIVFHPGLEWNMPLFQRPQHIAIHLAGAGALYFYATPNAKHDAQRGFKEIIPGCYLTDRFDLLSQLQGRQKFLHLYSSDMGLDAPLLDQLRHDWPNLIYEYIDELHPELSAKCHATGILRRHDRLLSDDSTLVVVTARRLYADALNRRHTEQNLALIGNGADCAHFAHRVEPPATLGDFLKRHPVRIGYFGALASWFDYELIHKIALERPDYGIILVGSDFDGSLAKSGLSAFPNIFLAGRIPYADLPAYAHAFTVGMIPFVVNDITLATSPIKLFEYMAAGLPVVSTDLPECARIPEVKIASDHPGFIRAIDEAVLQSASSETALRMRRVAAEHDWSAKARALLAILPRRP